MITSSLDACYSAGSSLPDTAHSRRHYAGDRCQALHDAWVLSMRLMICANSCWRAGLVVLGSVVVLGLEGGPELDAGLKVAAGFADRFEGAVQLL